MNPERMVIRAAERRDLAALVAYNLALAWETEQKRLDPVTVEAGVAALLGDPQRGFYTVAEVEGQVVGQVLITFEWSDWRNGWFWWLQSVYVQPAFRRRGVFRALVEHLEERARREGQVVGLRLYVERDNRAAQAVYAALGLQPTTYGVLEKCWKPV
ncbi:GNAT family N-acetyltransferase [Thermogemmata fonticola]|uniref:GNAT family N-acetyltransferase n=1 Tax=Thermogemmata fonticola TaxID=2755323 RepID=A0A7V8VGK6_9BACT|nr:GNAT family N-acetyltransferase [Thermogemmata fonticola]MBA2227674.1 GNAT family N-acetyltransferase [Thermogemmata fonticola]